MRISLLLALLALTAAPAAAQLSVGGQAGTPTGLSVKAGAGPGALLVAVGWDLDDSVEAEGHYVLRARRLQGTRRAQLFYGPGAFVNSNDVRTDAGISLGVGIEALLAPEIELYGLLSPRLQLTDETEFDLAGGLGLRLRL